MCASLEKNNIIILVKDESAISAIGNVITQSALACINRSAATAQKIAPVPEKAAYTYLAQS